ncbi:hypothetical protein HHX47_DHR1001636 [Lentinula edodes]|nr:hypothetical protein HHX47_DHR1001636 [Lentinula edodes]
MLPTLAASGEVVIEDRLSLRLNPASLARGDLIVVRSPIDPTAIVCKRVIGLPGDVVCVDPTGLKAPSTEHVLVPKGHIWICGDNMTHSRDSRDYGPVPIALIRSKLFARVNSTASYFGTLCEYLIKAWMQIASISEDSKRLSFVFSKPVVATEILRYSPSTPIGYNQD